EEPARLVEHEPRRVEERHLRAAPRVEERVEPAAGAELDDGEAAEPAEALPDEPLLRAPARRALLGVGRARVGGLDPPLRVPVGDLLHVATLDAGGGAVAEDDR